MAIQHMFWLLLINSTNRNNGKIIPVSPFFSMKLVHDMDEKKESIRRSPRVLRRCRPLQWEFPPFPLNRDSSGRKRLRQKFRKERRAMMTQNGLTFEHKMAAQIKNAHYA